MIITDNLQHGVIIIIIIVTIIIIIIIITMNHHHPSSSSSSSSSSSPSAIVISHYQPHRRPCPRNEAIESAGSLSATSITLVAPVIPRCPAIGCFFWVCNTKALPASTNRRIASTVTPITLTFTCKEILKRILVKNRQLLSTAPSYPTRWINFSRTSQHMQMAFCATHNLTMGLAEKIWARSG